MKLKCEEHDRRVMVLDSGSTVHRNDGSKCDSDLRMGDSILLPYDVRISNLLKQGLTHPTMG